ncbi:hypothetical protein AB0M46_28565 [Dactylosporangium sp. NPDC051485]|uniref:hypothetical protein n=1 Tax=Dactylosporangium sp. NPDC051485 TaxID=3154846 RepID=UPI00343491C5
MNTPLLSRRQLLTVTGLTIGVGTIGLADASPAAADPAAVPYIRLLGGHPLQVLSPGSAQPTWCPRQLAVEVVRTVALPASTVVTVSFDDRLYAAADPPTVTLDGHSVAATARFTGALTCTVTIEPAIPAGGQLLVRIANARAALYPHDLVPQPGVAAATLAARGAAPAGTDLRPATPDRRAQGTQPWGVELFTGWERHTWGDADEFSYHHPVRISLRGTGPGRAAYPTAFAIGVDPRLVDHVAVAGATLNRRPLPGSVRAAGEIRTAGGYTTRWRTSVMVGIGDVLDVALRVRPLKPAGALPTITHPVVTIWDMGNDVLQRQTGRTSSSRLDSVWR